jgi:hypothetical protein
VAGTPSSFQPPAIESGQRASAIVDPHPRRPAGGPSCAGGALAALRRSSALGDDPSRNLRAPPARGHPIPNHGGERSSCANASTHGNSDGSLSSAEFDQPVAGFIPSAAGVALLLPDSGGTFLWDGIVLRQGYRHQRSLDDRHDNAVTFSSMSPRSVRRAPARPEIETVASAGPG